MNILFPKRIINRIYKYLKNHSGETILYKDISEALLISYPTIRKYIKWLIKRELITKNGKKITVIDD